MSRLKLVSMQQIVLDGQTINYAVKRSQRARHVRLEIRLESGLTVIVPHRYNTEGIARFLYQKQLWILRKLEDCRKFQSNSMATISESISYLGQKLKIIERRDHNQLTDVSLEQNTITVNLGVDDKLAQVLEIWFRSQAEELITRKVNIFSQQIGVRFGRLTIRNARTRWGSCSRLGNLNFNWKLIKAPESVIDYVIVHELCHLKEMNHSSGFWNLVKKHCPNCYEYRAWLKQHEPEIAGN